MFVFGSPISITKRIADVEAELTKKRAQAAEVLASCRGLEAELAALRAGLGHEGDLVGVARTEAILAVLRQADEFLPPTGVVASLHASRRNDDARSVTATLDHLLKQGKVVKVGRGRYLAG